MVNAKFIYLSNNKGFTLIEVMVAVSILAFALVSLISAVGWNLDLTNRAKNFTIASNIANDIISRIEVEGIPSVRNDSGKIEDYPDFEWNLSIFPYNLKQLGVSFEIITVLITWDKGRESYEINLAVESS